MHYSSQEQNNDLLFQWVSSEIRCFVQREQLNDYNKQIIKWRQLISIGLVSKLFSQIDKQFFSEMTVSVRSNIKKDQDIRQVLEIYWKWINDYLLGRYSKKLSPKYILKQVDLGQNGWLRNRNLSKNNQVDSSIRQLIKLQFYLLVQKHNTSQQQQMQLQKPGSNHQLSHEQNPQHKQAVWLDQTCEQSLIRDGRVSQDYNLRHRGFLQRICELQQQVQEYLVQVVEGIQQQQILIQVNQQYHAQQQLTRKPSNSSSSSSNKQKIYSQIQEINQQNQHLQQQIQTIMEQNYRLQKQLQDDLQQENVLITKINAYNQQKKQLYEYLKQESDICINSLEELVDVVRHIEQQNQKLESTIADIQERNYELQVGNAQKVHAINKNALQITKINEQNSEFKFRIKDLRQDICYLDQIVKSTEFNAQLITSVDVDDQSQMMFNKSIDVGQTGNFEDVLRQNNDIYNQKLPQSAKYRSSYDNTPIITDVTIAPNNPRYSLNCAKNHKQKKNHLFDLLKSNQENIKPQTHQSQTSQILPYYLSKTLSHHSLYQQQQKQIEQEKQKYRNQLMRNLQQLYKEISDLTSQITTIKEENKTFQNKNRENQRKLNRLKQIHQAFVKEAHKK